jgi:hypothetical protein
MRTSCVAKGWVKTPAHLGLCEGAFSARGWGALSLPLEKQTVSQHCGFIPVTRKNAIGLQEELGVTACHGLEKRVSVSGGLGNGLAEGEGVDFADVARQVEMVRGDCAYINDCRVRQCI